jgi:hypothetical protein
MSSNQQGQLRLDILDVHGKRVGGRADVHMKHRVLSHSAGFNGLDASKRIVVKELFGAPQGQYTIEIDPGAYMPVVQFINIKSSGFTDLSVTVPVDPKKVISVNFPAFDKLHQDLRPILERSDKVLSFEGKKGGELYDAVDDIRKACLLNIATKCAHTRFSNGKTVLPFINKINELRGSRFFAVIPRELREETKNSVADGIFREVSGALHRPPDGFEEAGSFKTFDKHGNLQLTFFAKGDEWVADIDIDDAAGLEHAFQVLDHAIRNRDTHPFDIREILIHDQQIDPGYKFVV